MQKCLNTFSLYLTINFINDIIAYGQRYSDASSRTQNKTLALKEKFATEFGVLIEELINSNQ